MRCTEVGERQTIAHEHPDVTDQVEATVRDRLALESAPLPTADADEQETPETALDDLPPEI